MRQVIEQDDERIENFEGNHTKTSYRIQMKIVDKNTRVDNPVNH